MKRQLLLLTILFLFNSLFSQTFNTGATGIIPDNTCDITNEFQLDLTGQGLSNLDGTFGLETVCIDITHTYVSDLDVYIFAPDGTAILLTSDNGGSGANYTNTCFNMSGAAGNITAGAPPFTGTFIPQGDLGTINNGQDPNGVWTLLACDFVGGDEGTLNSWEITFGNMPAPPTAPPANNDCANAEALTVNADLNCTATTAGTVAGATASGEDEITCGGTENDDVWYSFVATSTSHTIDLLNVAGSTTDLYHSVWSGACGALTNILCSDPNNSTVTGLTIGTTYLLRVYSWTGLSGQNSTFDVCIGTPPPPPANNDCANAEALTVNADLNCTATTAGTIQSATASGEDEATCGGTEDDDVWYSFVATSTSHTIDLLNVAGSTTDLYHSVWSGACGTLTNILCSDPNNSIATGLTIGDTYLLRVYSFTAVTGQNSTFDVCIGTPPPPPANDLCAGAIPITPSAAGTGCGTATFTLPFSTDGTTDSGVPTVCSDPGLDQWFTWTATSTGLTFSSQTPGNPGIAVFANCADAAAGVDIACLGTFSNSNLSGWSIGDDLIIQVYDFQGSVEDVAFCLEEFTPPAAPANDDCANAEALTVNADLNCAATTAGTIASATASGEDETTCGGTENDDVWYSFVATNTSHTIDLLNVAGSTTDLYHSVWSGTCGALTNILCSDLDNSTATGLTIGVTYLLRVNSWGATIGQNSTFDVCIGTPPPPPANDACGGAIPITPVANQTGSTAFATNVEGLTACSGGGGGSTACPAPGGGGLTDFGAGVWYQYTSETADETITASTDNAGTDFDTEIQVFEGSCGSLTCIGGDDDNGSNGSSVFCWVSPTTASPGSPVNYFIYVDGHTTATGNFELSITAQNSPLPITLTSFSGEPMERTNMLKWETASEENTMYHIIQRSLNGNANWEEIGRLDAAGNATTTLQYSLEDPKPLDFAYYRLMSLDFDGYKDFSDIISIKRNVKVDQIHIYPSPVTKNLTIEIGVGVASDYEVSIVNLMGQIVSFETYDFNEGNQRIEMNTEHLANGIYHLVVESKTGKQIKKFVKQ